MTLTHQDIIDRREALGHERSEAYQREQARIAAERKSLQELCGGLGHFYARSAHPFGTERCCVFCEASEKGKG
jgi:hypothetical protein